MRSCHPMVKRILRAQTNVRVDAKGAEQEFFDYGDRPMGIIPDQDVAITIGQQLATVKRLPESDSSGAGRQNKLVAFNH